MDTKRGQERKAQKMYWWHAHWPTKEQERREDEGRGEERRRWKEGRGGGKRRREERREVERNWEEGGGEEREEEDRGGKRIGEEGRGDEGRGGKRREERRGDERKGKEGRGIVYADRSEGDKRRGRHLKVNKLPRTLGFQFSESPTHYMKKDGAKSVAASYSSSDFLLSLYWLFLYFNMLLLFDLVSSAHAHT